MFIIPDPIDPIVEQAYIASLRTAIHSAHTLDDLSYLLVAARQLTKDEQLKLTSTWSKLGRCIDHLMNDL